MVHENVEAKSGIILSLEKCDAEIVHRFSMHGISSASACIRRGRHVKHKIPRVGKWLPPPTGFLKINTDGSSRGNLGSAGIGGIGRDSSGLVVFIFLANKGCRLLIRWKAWLSYML